MNSSPSPFGDSPNNPWASEGTDGKPTPAMPGSTTAEVAGSATGQSKRRSWGITAAVAVVALAVGAGAGWFLGDNGSEEATDDLQMYSGDGIYGFPNKEIENVPEVLAEGLFYCEEGTVSNNSQSANGVDCEVAVGGYRGVLRYVGSDESRWISDQLETAADATGYEPLDVEGLDAAEFSTKFDFHDDDVTMLVLTVPDNSFYLDVSARDVHGDEPSTSEDRGFIRAVEAALGATEN
ncbi:hypothetical protein [Corynebacterium variabile]|uniref:hypothetical protein n=1 Tax=Corynebacterium variabile TaxID=1727 RepID=UPI003A8DECB3